MRERHYDPAPFRKAVHLLHGKSPAEIAIQLIGQESSGLFRAFARAFQHGYPAPLGQRQKAVGRFHPLGLGVDDCLAVDELNRQFMQESETLPRHVLSIRHTHVKPMKAVCFGRIGNVRGKAICSCSDFHFGSAGECLTRGVGDFGKDVHVIGPGLFRRNHADGFELAECVFLARHVAEIPGRFRVLTEGQHAKLRDAGELTGEGEAGGFAAGMVLAPDLECNALAPQPRLQAELGKRNGRLNMPFRRLQRATHSPGGRPVAINDVVVLNLVVSPAYRASGAEAVHHEVDEGGHVVVGVEQEFEAIVLPNVAAILFDVGPELGCVGAIEGCADIHIVLIVKDLEFGAFLGRLARAKTAVQPMGRSRLPTRLIELAVDNRRLIRRHGTRGSNGREYHVLGLPRFKPDRPVGDLQLLGALEIEKRELGQIESVAGLVREVGDGKAHLLPSLVEETKPNGKKGLAGH